MSLHPLVADAARGRLPDWAVASESTRTHMGRVADLMGSWAEALRLDADARARWMAAAHLHDALRDEDADRLRERVPPALRVLPGPTLHGPVAAERLRIDGVEDGELLAAVASHTLGSASFDRLGRALYAADFLDPGRSWSREWREALRARMPLDMDEVIREVVGARIRHSLDRRRRIFPETVAFWNRLAEEAA